jgi:hypothetical protein
MLQLATLPALRSLWLVAPHRDAAAAVRSALPQISLELKDFSGVDVDVFLEAAAALPPPL